MICALKLLTELQEYAESAAAARLEQMHGHLTTHPKASGYDGTAAQVHQHYAQALAPIVEALRGTQDRVSAVQVGWWEQVIALMDPDGPETPALQERAETLKRCNHELYAALGDQP